MSASRGAGATARLPKPVDGTLDAVLSDWDFNAATSRTIAVDLRYVLWQLQVVDKADALLAEMGVQ